MALPQPKQSFRHWFKASILLLIIPGALFTLQSCKHKNQVYKSDCDLDVAFKHVNFRQLLDSISNYDQQFVEVTGKYEEDKELSALVSDSLFNSNSADNALWVNFSQDCPLFLTGTNKGLFEYADGQFTLLNNKSITIRGKIDLHNKGSHKKYKATIDRISLVKL